MSNNTTTINVPTKRLGKGLEALIPQNITTKSKSVQDISIAEIKPNPYQPRTNFDSNSLKELSESIKNHGLAQPIIVRKVDNYYELVAGERRFRACVIAKMDSVPAIIKDFSDKESLQVALIENLQRKDLDPVETSFGYKRLIDEFGLTHEQVAKVFSKSRSSISNTLRLLTLPTKIQEMIQKSSLSEGHARALLAIDSEDKMLEMAKGITQANISVRDTESMVSRETKRPVSSGPKPMSSPCPDFAPIIDFLEKKLGARVFIQSKNGSGKLQISFNDIDDLKRIHKLLQ